MTKMKYSVIIPVYNRPEEVSDLLESLKAQTYRDFEVIIVEDGSSIRCDHIVERFASYVKISYYLKPNEGPGPARNFGFTKAAGEYFVVFDSDCILPPEYLHIVDTALAAQNLDAWGGPDKAHERFTLLQRAMGYTMSSVFTTGGIRGGAKSIGAFQPRSFNMGLSRKVFDATGGFRFARFAEDIELSIRMKKQGFRVGLIPEAFVYHKRRTDLKQFFKQVSNFGRGRAQAGAAHKGHVKLTHWFPAFFTSLLISLLVLPFLSLTLFYIAATVVASYLATIFLHSLYINRNLLVALLSIPSTVVQLTGYGIGFMSETTRSYFGKSG
jgi:glycosyltransferase involved in cell wall biosynthesis